VRTCFKLDVFLYWFYAFHYESDVLWRTCSSPKILKWICNFSVSNVRMLAIIMGLQNNQNHMRFNCVVNHTSFNLLEKTFLKSFWMILGEKLIADRSHKKTEAKENCELWNLKFNSEDTYRCCSLSFFFLFICKLTTS
jgi:hypothetical protein